jgi:hypothetical protein
MSHEIDLYPHGGFVQKPPDHLFASVASVLSQALG